jgi:hypothetical protein
VARTLLTLVIGTIVAAVPAFAHHSFSASYFEEQSVSIEGEVQEFHYQSPHAILRLAARDAAGAVHIYAAEWSNPRQLGRRGVTKDTLRPGDYVIVTGSPGRVASEHKIHLKRISRPSDGWSWDGGRR